MKLVRLVAAAVALLPVLATAQSVTLYGVIDTGMEYVNNVGSAKNGVARLMGNTGTVPSRWGLRGTEDLGGGLKSIFVLESGFFPDSGSSSMGGRLFGRQAFVGLNGAWGQVAFGRQVTMLYWSYLDSDILGANIFGSSSLDSYMTFGRADNAVSYKGTFNGLTVGATYSFGRDTVNAGPSPAGTNCAGENPADSRTCREWSALLQYQTAWWGVAAAYDENRGGPGAFGGLVRSNMTDKRATATAYAIFDKAKVGAGVIWRNNDGSSTPRSDLWYVGAAYDITPAFTLAGQAYLLRFHDTSNKAWLFALRASYAFTKRTLVYATTGYINNRGQSAIAVDGATPPPPGVSQLGGMLGIKHVF
ncbi:porin [Cupriavidus basilensis OR16]|uniref:Porin n=1 Tax=Cupriavidus basilensis OR16 TaxID=1127483 RepID=H1RYK2_9BURK|nr:porin [Cupriavidus basilensis]EHP44693.1 porin [Cupriavidus basilensis OR16]